jgi:tetratricopeptide (TPR) repeat protein
MVSGVACDRPASSLDSRDPHDAAWLNFRLREFAEARKAFDAVIADGSRDDGDLARFGLILNDSVGEGRDFDLARRELQAKLDAEPDGLIAPWVMLALVRLDHVPPTSDVSLDVPKLIAAYTAVSERYPGTLAAAEAQLYRAALLAGATDNASLVEARQYIETLLGETGEHPFRQPLYSLLSSTLTRLKDHPAALAAQIRSLETKEIDPANPNLDNAFDYFSIAINAQYDVGDFETARIYYRKLLEEYPADQRVFLAKTNLAEMDRIEAELRAELGGTR